MGNTGIIWFRLPKSGHIAPLGILTRLALVLLLITSVSASNWQDKRAHEAETPTPEKAGELMQWLSLYLDTCSYVSRATQPPSCRCRFSYWFWDDPATTYAPDRLYIFGGISGSGPHCDDFTISTKSHFLRDFWQLSWSPSLAPQPNQSWEFQWTCLQGCDESEQGTEIQPSRRADAIFWTFGGTGDFDTDSENTEPSPSSNPSPSDIESEDELNPGSAQLTLVQSPISFPVDSLFLYGGYGPGSNHSFDAPRGYHNDLWRYDVFSGDWSLVNGREEPFYSLTEYELSLSLSSSNAVASYGRDIILESNPGELTSKKPFEQGKREFSEISNSVSESAVSMLQLSPLAGGSAYVRQATSNGAWPATVVVAGGQAFGIGSNSTFFIDAGRYNASQVTSSNPPRVRVGGLLYAPILGLLAVTQYGGFNEQSEALFDLQALGLYSGSWSYICDSVFCSENTDITWCRTCLKVMPTQDFDGGLKFASYLVTNTSNGPSRVVIGGFTRSSNIWIPATWTVVRGTELEHPILPTSFCSQPNPSPFHPSDFQCVGNTWRASNLCLHCPMALNLTFGQPIEILGDWAPDQLSLTVQPGSMLNVSGALTLLNLTADMHLSDEMFETLARSTTGRLSVVEAASVTCPSLLGSEPNVTTLRRSLVEGCTTTTFFSSSWSTGRTLDDRRTIDIVLNWKTELTAGCKAPDANHSNKGKILPFIVGFSVLAVFLLALVAMLLIVKFDRVKTFFKNLSTRYSGEKQDPVSHKTDTDEESSGSKNLDPSAPNATFPHVTHGNHVNHHGETPALLESYSMGSTIITRSQSTVVHLDPLSPRASFLSKSKSSKRHVVNSSSSLGAAAASAAAATSAAGYSNANASNHSSSSKKEDEKRNMKSSSSSSFIPESSNPRDSIALGCTPRSGVSRSDLDYESGLGSLETSVQNEFEEDDDLFVPDLSMV